MNVSVKTRAAAAPAKPAVLPGVKNIIGVSSGKGGVGKSTVAANLAVALAAKGYKVGLLDADIFGPSMPKMFGVEDEQLYMVNKEGRDWIEPIERYGVKMLSIGFLVDKEKPVLWRGGMASNALKQLITDAWTSGDMEVAIAASEALTTDLMKGSVGLSKIRENDTLAPSMRMSSSIILFSARLLPLPGYLTLLRASRIRFGYNVIMRKNCLV